MLKMKRLAAALLTFIMLLIAQTALAGGDAIVDDFTARMVIGIDGSLSVEETITYSVTDSINGFTRDIDPSFGSGYFDFSAARIIDGSEIAMRYDESAARGDEGVYYAEQQDNGLVRYYMFVPCGEGDEVTMVYRYRLEDVCKRYLDVGVLDMPLLGDAWEMDIDSYTGRIEFIGQVEGNIDMLVKSAGMNLTECAVTDGGIDFAGEDAGSGGVFRVRLMFPSGALSGMVYTSEENMRGRILADEAEYQAALEESDRMGKIVLLCAIIVMAAAIAAACLIWGRDPRVDACTYTTGAPLPVRGDIGPAEVKMIFSGSLPDTNTLAAVMLDLTRRGYIDIVGGKGDMEYVRTAKPIDDCSDQEQFVLNWIMNIGDGESVTLDAVRKAAEKSAYSQKFMDWTKMVRRSVNAGGWFVKRTAAQIAVGVILLVMAAAAILIGLSFMVNEGPYGTLGMFTLFSFMPLVIGGLVVLVAQKRTYEGARVCAEWKSVKKWIKSGWDVNDPSIDTALWEELMVYALPLGVSDKLAKRLDKLDPEYASAMCNSKDAMILRGRTETETILTYGWYCSSVSRINSAHSSSSGGGGGSGAGGGGGGGTF